jgi:hypothetical protein
MGRRLTVEQLSASIVQVSILYYRLVLLVASAGGGKTTTLLNVSE